MKPALLVSACLAVSMGPVAASDITIGVPNWAAAQAIAYMLDTLIERDTGLEVERVPSTNPIIFKAMDSGDMDVHPDVWLPPQQSLKEEFVQEKGTVNFSDKSYGGFAGFCVTKKTADELGIKSIYDLADPEIAEHFDTNGDGMGEIWVGASGWAGTSVDTVRLTSYGVSDTFELLQLDETVALSRLKDADKQGEPFATLCFAPNLMFALADLVQLEEPPYDEAKWTMVQPTDDPNWLEKSNIEVAYPPMTIQIGYASRLEVEQPRAAEIIRGVQLDTEMINDWNYKIVEEKTKAEDVVDSWMTANEDRVNGWLGF